MTSIVAPPRQVDLFPETAPQPDPLIGRTVTMDAPCLACGSTTALIGPGRGPHLGELRCRSCNKHRQWISRESYTAIAKFVAKIANTFGAPETINFRSLNTRCIAPAKTPAPDLVPFDDPLGF
jgi:hypothetical protein